MCMSKSLSIWLAIMPWLIGWPALTDAKNYVHYTYEHQTEENYHVGDLELTDDGSITIGIGGVSTIADEEVVVFTADQKKPAWKYNIPTDMVLFDSDISADGSTIVACGSAVWVIDVASQELLWTYDESVYVFDTCTLSEDGSSIFAGSRQSQIFKWSRSSNEYEQLWTFSDGGFIDQVVVSRDGSTLLAENSYSYVFIDDTTSSDFAWEKSITDEIYSIGMDDTGTRGYVIVYDRSTSNNSDYYVAGITTTSPQWKWKRKFRSYNTPYGDMSAQGNHLALSTNDVYYGLNGKTGKKDWQFTRDGSNTTIALSGNGKFVVITEGIDYIYFFDWGYPGKRQRPFQIDSGIFPGAAGISQDGSTATYEHQDITYQQIVPGMLTDLLDTIPVYQSGDTMTVRYFVSNPGAATSLKIRTSLSLPQITFLSELGDAVTAEPPTTKMKSLSYKEEVLPGYNILDKRKVTVSAHDSYEQSFEFEVPNMLLPEWLEDLIGTLMDVLDIGGTLLEELGGPLSDLVSETRQASMETSTVEMLQSLSYPMIGLGKVELYDPKTETVYSSDSFIFIYVL